MNTAEAFNVRSAAWTDLKMPLDPSALLFPDLSREQYAALKRDIAAHGVREPIWVTRKGLLLDGRHRRRACIELGIECPERVYEGDDPIAFVASLNLHRRHLTTRERAEIAAQIATTIKEAAKLMKVSPMSVKRAKARLRPAPTAIKKPVTKSIGKGVLTGTSLSIDFAGLAPEKSLAACEEELRAAIAAIRIEYPFERRQRFVDVLYGIMDHAEGYTAGEWTNPKYR
jgi:hypothetical protein